MNDIKKRLLLCVDRNCCADLNDNDIQIIERMIKISEFDELLSHFKAFALKLLDVYTSVEHYQTIQSNEFEEEFDVLKKLCIHFENASIQPYKGKKKFLSLLFARPKERVSSIVYEMFNVYIYALYLDKRVIVDAEGDLKKINRYIQSFKTLLTNTQQSSVENESIVDVSSAFNAIHANSSKSFPRGYLQSPAVKSKLKRKEKIQHTDVRESASSKKPSQKIKRTQLLEKRQRFVCHENTFENPFEKTQVDTFLRSQVHIDESMHLTLNTNRLSDFERVTVIDCINGALKSNDLEQKYSAVLLLLVLLTAKQYKNILSWSISSSLDPSSEGVCLKQRGWKVSSVKLPSSYVQEIASNNVFLNKHIDKHYLPLPLDLLEVFDGILHERKKNTVSLSALLPDPKSSINKFLLKIKKDNNLNRHITIASIRAELFASITSFSDASLALLTLANEEFDNTHQLYYLSAKVHSVKALYVNSVTVLGYSNLSFTETLSNECVVGSQNSLNIVNFSNRIHEKLSRIRHDINHFDQLDEKKCIGLWNDISYYSITLLNATTSRRAAKVYDYAITNVDFNNLYVQISDKKSKSDSSIRINSLSSLTKNILIQNISLQKQIATKLEKYHAHYLTLKQNAHEHGECLFHRLKQYELKRVTSATYKEWIGADCHMKNNILRASLCSNLRVYSKISGPLVKLIMGHVHNKEHIFNHYSNVSLSDNAVKNEEFDEYVTALGFELITEKRATRSINLPMKNVVHTAADINEWEKIFNVVCSKFDVHYKKMGSINEAYQQAVTCCIEEIKNNEMHISDSSLSKIFYFLNEYVQERNESNELLNNIYYFEVKNENLSNLNSLTLYESQQNKQSHQQLREYFLEHIDKQSRWSSFLISQLLFSINNHTLKEWFYVLKEDRFVIQKNIAWVNFAHERIILDSLSTSLLLSCSSEKDHVTYESLYEMTTEILSEALQEKVDFDTIRARFIKCRGYDQTGHENALLNNSIEHTKLSDEAFIRFMHNSKITTQCLHRKKSENRDLLVNHNRSDITVDFREEVKSFLYKKYDKEIWQPQSLRRFIEQLLIKKISAITSNMTFREMIEIALDHVSSSEISTLIFLYDRSYDKGRQGDGNLSTKTLYNDFNLKHLNRLLCLIDDNDLRDYDEDDFLELYEMTIESVTSFESEEWTSTQVRLFKLIQRFHRSLCKYNLASGLNWSVIKKGEKDDESTRTSTSIITYSEYKEARKIAKTSSYLSDAINVALILGFKLGLRPREIYYLQVEDFEFQDLIHIRTKAGFRTKTPKSNRRVPLSLFLTTEENTKIKQYLLAKSEGGLFADVFVSCRSMSKTLRELLVEVTDDPGVRTYDLRHSFASYQYLFLMTKDKTSLPTAVVDYVDDMRLSIEDYIREFFAKTAMVGYEHISVLIILARLLGHTYPKMSLKHYVHTVDIVTYLNNECESALMWKVKHFSAATRFKSTLISNVIKRAKNPTLKYQEIAKRMINDRFDYTESDQTCLQLKRQHLVDDVDLLNKLRLIKKNFVDDKIETFDSMYYQLKFDCLRTNKRRVIDKIKEDELVSLFLNVKKINEHEKSEVFSLLGIFLTRRFTIEKRANEQQKMLIENTLKQIHSDNFVAVTMLFFHYVINITKYKSK